MWRPHRVLWAVLPPVDRDGGQGSRDFRLEDELAIMESISTFSPHTILGVSVPIREADD